MSCIPSLLFAQSNVKVIENQFLDYNQLIKKKDFSKALDQYAHEGFLKFVPKETMVLIFDKMFNDPNMKFFIGSSYHFKSGRISSENTKCILC